MALIKLVLPFLLGLAFSAAASAQEAPAPRRMPRTPVKQKVLSTHNAAPSSRKVSGIPTIIDGEKFQIDKVKLRLFGIVPPQLAASFGPQARAHLDALVADKSIGCAIRDRSKDGRLLATCTNTEGKDLALELLALGLAVSARGSLEGTDLADAYFAAEQAAMDQKLGLWSISLPKQTQQVKTTTKVKAPASSEGVAPKTNMDPKMREKIAEDLVASQDAALGADDEAVWDDTGDISLFERYQGFASGLLILLTALCVLASLKLQRIRDRRDEIKALAAALRGELMAARAICAGRAKHILTESDDLAASWPRIRATLYQAYVNRLGLLGAELARQISSIYGQASDYAFLYNAPNAPSSDVPKKQALETLIRHIDEVLPKLTDIERTGKLAHHQAVLPHHFRARTTTFPRRPLDPPPMDPPMPPPSHTPPPPHDAPSNTETPQEDETAYHAEEALEEPPATPCPLSPPTPPSKTISEHLRAHIKKRPHLPLETLSSVWTSVRGLVQRPKVHRRAPPPSPAYPIDPSIAEYTAMIEADMERYQYSEHFETLDISPPRKNK